MDARAAAIAAGRAAELVWLLEHPPLYTAGTSAQRARPDRGALSGPSRPGAAGSSPITGPGQRVVYLMLDLKRRAPDVRRYVASLEEWLIRTLGAFNVRGERREDRIGVWVRAARQGRGPRGQDRRDRHPAQALGQPARHRAQRRSGPVAFLRHRAVRRRGRALRRDQPRRPRARRHAAGGRHGAAAGVRGAVRRDADGRDRRHLTTSPARSRRAQVIAFGWHAMPMFEQTGSPFSARAQVRQPSVHSGQVLSRVAVALHRGFLGAAGSGAGSGCCGAEALDQQQGRRAARCCGDAVHVTPSPAPRSARPDGAAPADSKLALLHVDRFDARGRAARGGRPR